MAERTFARRTYWSYRSHQQRAQEVRQSLDYTLDRLRLLVRAAIDHKGCYYCGVELSSKTFSIDHRQPVSRGGAFAYTNFCVTCQGCNRAKAPLTEEEYFHLLKAISALKTQARSNILARLKDWKVKQKREILWAKSS